MAVPTASEILDNLLTTYNQVAQSRNATVTTQSGETLTKQDLPKLLAQIKYWRGQVALEARAASGQRRTAVGQFNRPSGG